MIQIGFDSSRAVKFPPSERAGASTGTQPVEATFYRLIGRQEIPQKHGVAIAVDPSAQYLPDDPSAFRLAMQHHGSLSQSICEAQRPVKWSLD
jgi:hypothetical protein